MNQDNEETAEVIVIKFYIIKFSINKLCNVIIYLSEWNAEVLRILAWKINRPEGCGSELLFYYI